MTVCWQQSEGKQQLLRYYKTMAETTTKNHGVVFSRKGTGAPTALELTRWDLPPRGETDISPVADVSTHIFPSEMTCGPAALTN